MNRERLDSRGVGLQIGSLIGRYFLKTGELHYGYWSGDLAVDITNFARAQEQYSEFIRTHIPDETRTILDVGAGTGDLARRLKDRGYRVDCVSPSRYFSEIIAAKLGEGQVYTSTFEALQTEARYDLVLFSESFQYVKLRPALEKAFQLLRPGGHLLICDFFRTAAEGRSALRGGHRYSRFSEMMDSSGFVPVLNLDITSQTAPTIQIYREFLEQVAEPVRDLTGQYLTDHYPRTTGLLKWIFRKKLAKIRRTHFSGRISAEAFKKYKTYRLLLYRHP